jgi:hypothetical protein
MSLIAASRIAGDLIAQPAPRQPSTLQLTFGCFVFTRLAAKGSAFLPDRSARMNSVLSLSGAAHRYRRTDAVAEIRAGER